MGFSSVESIALILLELVDYVYRLSVRRCSEFCTGIGGVVIGTSLAPGSVAGGRTVGVETCVNKELAEVWRFSQSDRWSFGEEARVDGFDERRWKPYLRIRLRQ